MPPKKSLHARRRSRSVRRKSKSLSRAHSQSISMMVRRFRTARRSLHASARDLIRNHPLRVLAAASGTGAVLGRTLSRSRSPPPPEQSADSMYVHPHRHIMTDTPERAEQWAAAQHAARQQELDALRRHH